MDINEALEHLKNEKVIKFKDHYPNAAANPDPMKCVDIWLIINDGSRLIRLDVSYIIQITTESYVEMLNRDEYIFLLIPSGNYSTFSIVKKAGEKILNISYELKSADLTACIDHIS